MSVMHIEKMAMGFAISLWEPAEQQVAILMCAVGSLQI